MPDGTVTTLECPKDEGTMLVAVDRNGVTVDACPRCRGVWLDRGELDKLIALESAPDEEFLAEIRGSSTDAGPAPAETGGHHGSGKHGSKSSGHGSKSSGYGRKKRGGMLGDFFDFG